MFRPKAWRQDPAHKRPSARPCLEQLESRIVPYNVTGNAWPNPQLITISFVPDGTLIGYNQNGPIYSTLFQDFNARFGSPAAWQKPIELAAQAWADATNINFSVVGDDGVPIGTVGGDDEQGDPNIGDIRIAGFQDTGAPYLAQAFQPPPANDYSLAGDMWFNTNQPFHIGTTYDLFTVAAHEIGHALGMDHSANPSAIMAPVYPGTRTALTSDDIAGIEAIYSDSAPRDFDAYNDGLIHNSTFLTAAPFTVDSGSLTAQLTNLDITKVGQIEYFKFVAPAGSSTLNLSIQSAGLSLLEPRVWVYNGAQTQLAFKSGVGNYGDALNVTVNNVVGGKTYYIKVNGAETTALGTGEYALSLSLGANPLPSVALPNTQTPNGNSITSGGSMAEADGDQYDAGSPFAGTIAGLLNQVEQSFAALDLTTEYVLPQQAWARPTLQMAMEVPQGAPCGAHTGHTTTTDATDETALETDVVEAVGH
jgi:hypothetical protein